MEKIVPRLSAPIITYAFATPGRGFETTLVMNDSQFPEIEDTSSRVRLTIASIKEDFPRVPIMIGVADVLTSEVTFVIFGVIPVTLSMSETKSSAAR